MTTVITRADAEDVVLQAVYERIGHGSPNVAEAVMYNGMRNIMTAHMIDIITEVVRGDV